MHGEPHACGEYSRSVAQRQRACGSSPRVWGIPGRAHELRPGRRFIPTRVGNTKRKTPQVLMEPVHPHACGEYIEHHVIVDDAGGSSPRVWGIQKGHSHRLYLWRFIPTRVGNTCRPETFPVHDTVHPHACGEYQQQDVFRVSGDGSSPRVWGILGVLTLNQ